MQIELGYLHNCLAPLSVFHTFPKGICTKVNVIARLEFELAYYDSADHCSTRTHTSFNESDVKVYIGKIWIAIDRLSIERKSDHSYEIKRRILPSCVCVGTIE